MLFECLGWEYDIVLFENIFVMEVSLCKIFNIIYYDYIVIWLFFINKSVYNIKKFKKNKFFLNIVVIVIYMSNYVLCS